MKPFCALHRLVSCYLSDLAYLWLLRDTPFTPFIIIARIILILFPRNRCPFRVVHHVRLLYALGKVIRGGFLCSLSGGGLLGDRFGGRVELLDIGSGGGLLTRGYLVSRLGRDTLRRSWLASIISS